MAAGLGVHAAAVHLCPVRGPSQPKMQLECLCGGLGLKEAPFSRGAPAALAPTTGCASPGAGVTVGCASSVCPTARS